MKYNFVALLFVIVIFWFTQGAFISVKEQLHCADIYKKANAVLYDLVDEETGQRGFLLTNDPAYLGPYTVATTKLNTDLSQFKATLTQSNKDEVTKVEDLISFKTKELAITIDLRKNKGLDSALDVVKTNAGHEWMIQIRSIINGIINNASNQNQLNAIKLAEQIEYIRFCLMGLMVLFVLRNGILLWQKFAPKPSLKIT